MNRHNILIKWENSFKREYILEVISNFEYIRNILFDDRNIEDVINSYLLYEDLKNKKIEVINNFKSELNNIDMKKDDLINYSVNKLRYDNRLKEWLKNVNVNELYKLKNIVNISNEFNEIDKFKFEEEKLNRGKNIVVNLNN